MKKLFTLLLWNFNFSNAQSYKKPLVSAITEKDLKLICTKWLPTNFGEEKRDFRRTESFDVVCR
jgi:hypothetical protein